MIKIVVFDIDGVLTDGTYTVDSNGVESKKISFKDLDSFNLLKELNVETIFITSEKNKITEYFNHKFKPDVFYDGVKDKYKVLKRYIQKNNISFSEICYIGDGKKDIKCIKSAGLSICPSNAIDEVKKKSTIVLNTTGGNGVAYSVYKIIENIFQKDNKKTKEEKENSFDSILDNHIEIVNRIKNNIELQNDVKKAVNIMIKSLKNNGKILACGNGGSAADSQHFVAELMSRFMFDRKSIPAIALTTNTSIITSIGNDYTYDRIFARQIEGLGQKTDVLLAITTSGSSENIKLAIEESLKKGMKVVLITSEKCNIYNENIITIKIPSSDTPRIQEFHIIVIHHICELIESELLNYEK